ncbi:GTPase activating protein [Penicillium brasilianum]|uniref:GTPase-activating protein GYP5 n=1 Tax=Penicillium brasilianum TaxID=104259 RepID=A0A1S9RC51_PENBI|nr:GTPase activating protein [Penicillium brasilianum]
MSNRNSSDYAGESFDDAPEAPEHLNVTIPKSTSTRSLTDSPPVGSGASPEITDKPSFPSASQDEQGDETTDGGGSAGKKKNKKKNKKKAKQDEAEAMADVDADAEFEAVDAPIEDVKLDTTEKAKEEDKQDHILTPVEADDAGEGEETPRRNVAQKSPLLTSHRLSTASSLDEVNLTTSKDDELPPHQIATPKLNLGSPPVPPKDDVASPPSSGLIGLSGSLPSLPWGPPPVNKNPAPVAPPPPPSRKPSGPFAWFSRSSTSGKDIKSPPQTGRRNTSTSVSTVASGLDLVDGDTSSVHSRRPRRNSLKDQFKILRMREESALPENDEGSVRSGNASISHAGASPPIIPEENEDGILVAPAAPASGATSPGGVPPSTINPGLAPGTVSGFSQSATDAAAPVDWDLWQQLVNNGPQALASSEELNAAIKRGIPQTIRGVIWQILADCKIGELEEIYRELLARGTDKDHRTPSVQINGLNEKESIPSSRSSIRSNNSGSGTQSTSVIPSPSQEIDPEKMAREQAVSEAARLKKAKDEASALSKLEKTIRRDLGARTSYSKYFVSQGSQESLFGLCKAYALYDEAVGYAQGMNFIVMPLLFNMDEADAFELLVKLMNKYRLREMFIAEMPGLHRSLYQFERLLEDLEPALYCHLRRRGVPPQLYATQWFLTLFAYRFPLQLVLRIYDLIFEEGLEVTILKFSIAIMRRNAEALLEMKDMSVLTTFLKERLFDAYIDKQPSASSILESGFFGSSGAADKETYRADLLVQDACAVPLTQETINSYTAEWEEKVRTEREREVELEGLRHTVSTQAARLRLLEERSEASDKEHVQLASELVHAKVENEELRDLTDALKLQVEQLKNVVDKQPGEVEEKLRLEMDRIMKRNIEVQNENRAMEDSMAEMEKELVATKMKWAEISEEHETLRQKWSDLRRALD